ncbi:hypothetical protein MMC16_001018 [Acarospora aff. strigata]|nr:hypothetical protein [Acarospora aff. strigata]
MSNPGNVIGGHKANLNNPNTSEESKQHSQEVLEKEYGVSETGSSGGSGGNTGNTGNTGSSGSDDSGKNPNNVIGGLKATTKNPNVSDEAKESAEQRLKEMGQ